MTLEEAKAKKYEAKQKILDILQHLEDELDLTVERIEIMHVGTLTGRRARHVHVVDIVMEL